MSFVQYIKSKRAWKHLAYVAGLYVLLMLLSWFYLSWYTGHGEYVTIPDVRGKLLTEATEIMEDLDLEVVVIDSGTRNIFDDLSFNSSNGNHQHQARRIRRRSQSEVGEQGDSI
jgi:hypothetical protein